VTLGRRFRSFQNLSVTFMVETTDYDPIQGFTTSSTTSSLRPVYSFDTRNNFYRPSRGYQLIASAEYGGAALGGENSFIKPQAEMQFFIPTIRNHFIGINLELGYVRPLQSDILQTYERFFLGGERSLRNYGTRSVGPTGFLCTYGAQEAVEKLSDCPPCPLGLCHQRQSLGFFTSVVGGTTKALFNIEYVIPLSQPVDLVLYADVGNAFAEWETPSFSNMPGDAGLELRFFLPVFGAPLRLIWGQTFNESGFEDSRSFLFSIGTTF